MAYIENRMKIAEYLDEDTDRITLESLVLNDHHSSVALETNGRVQYWDTVALHTSINSRELFNCHPVTRRRLNDAEVNYINHYYKCFNLLQNRINVNVEEILNNLQENTELARAVLTPYDFPVFKKYLENGFTRFERVAAEKELAESAPGTWGLRYSSFNRTIDKKVKERLGLKFYAISFLNNLTIVNHVLILHQPGWGWCQITGIVCKTEPEISINPFIDQGSPPKYYPCFFDVLQFVTSSFLGKPTF